MMGFCLTSAASNASALSNEEKARRPRPLDVVVKKSRRVKCMTSDIAEQFDGFIGTRLNTAHLSESRIAGQVLFWAGWASFCLWRRVWFDDHFVEFITG